MTAEASHRLLARERADVGAQLLVAAFFVLDGAGVVLGLFLIHRQRCIDDICDMRYRDHPDRARRTLGR